MAKITIAKGDWIVVCDGATALLLVNEGTALAPHLVVREAREEPHATTRALGADAPGRVHQAGEPGRSSVEQTDWHAQAEAAFLRGFADELETLLRAEHPRRVHVVAPPRALGVLRQAYGPALRRALGEEIGKDLASAPVAEIQRSLCG
ncbi:MAG TPA: host attachment protein [Beijerinckiaceae bacterium]